MKNGPRILAVGVPALFLILGLWLVVIKPLGPGFALIPGTGPDPRLNNYILEHFYRWAKGLEASYWTAPFFYPYQYTIAFSDNLLGSAPLYAMLRWVGLDRESAYQGWYVLGYALNFLAAAYVLSRWRLAPLGVAAGAFFFAFGLPILGQESRAQLLYRFCVPLACFFLWKMTERARLYDLLVIIFLTVWQFYLGIYMGVFLFLLLVGLIVLWPIFLGKISWKGYLLFWPRRVYLAWASAPRLERGIVSSLTFILGLSLAGLLWPYYQVTRLYGFERPWLQVSRILPTWHSYLLADRSQIWRFLAPPIKDLHIRQEHQLFPGGAAIILAAIGFVWAGYFRKSAFALVSFFVILLLVALTFSYHGMSLYRILWSLPGMNSIRAVTRVVFVLMWPLAVLIAYGCDVMVSQTSRYGLLLVVLAYLLAGALVAEAVLFDHATFNKAEAQARLVELRRQIPATIPDRPILVVGNQESDAKAHILETEAMLLAQELGWPTLNGHTGNLPPGYGRTRACKSIPRKIRSFMAFDKISSETYFTDMINRIVVINLKNCDPVP